MAEPNEISDSIKTLIREYLHYDDEIGYVVWRRDSRNGKYRAGDAIRDCVSISIGGRKLWYHRVVWFLAFGVFPTSVIRHRNGDKHDNRPENLIVPRAKRTHTSRIPPERLDRIRANLAELRWFADRCVGTRGADFRVWGLDSYAASEYDAKIGDADAE